MSVPNTFAYTTSELKSSPPSAVYTLPFTNPGFGWVSGTWVEVSASLPDQWIVSGIATINIVASALYEIQIGTGGAGNQIPIATVGGFGGSGGYFRFNLPLRLRAGTHVWMRCRTTSGPGSGSYPVGLNYYEGPLPDDQDPSLCVDVGPTLTGTNTEGLAVGSNATPWANGNWVTLAPATSTPWTLNSALIYTDFFIGIPETDVEVDVGVGAPGHEVVKTTGRVRTWFAPNSTGNIQFWPSLSGIAAGERVALRVRSSVGVSGGIGITYRVKIGYYPVAPASTALTTTQPTTFTPSAAAPISVVSGSGGWADGTWVPFIASTSSPIGITQIVTSDQNVTGESEIDVGIALAGAPANAEVVVGTFRWGLSLPGTFQNLTPQGFLMIARQVPAGYRVSLRSRTQGSLAMTLTAALGYIANPAFAQLSDSAIQSTYIAAASGPTMPASGMSYGYSAWGILTPATASAILVAGISFVNLLSGGNINDLIQLGVADPGSDDFQVIGTFNIGFFGTGNYAWQPLPLLYPIPVATRIGVRWTTSSTLPSSGNRFGLMYYGDIVPPVGDCPELTDEAPPDPPPSVCLPLADLYTLVTTAGELITAGGAEIEVEVDT